MNKIKKTIAGINGILFLLCVLCYDYATTATEVLMLITGTYLSIYLYVNLDRFLD